MISALTNSLALAQPHATPAAPAPASQPDAPKPPLVLSTLNPDGSRRWLKPKPSKGRFWRRRIVVAFALIAIFTLLPWININGHPSILLDLATRHFYIFGATFLPTDTLLLAFLLVGIFIAIFLFTAVLGRVWCGWACPQTVYMEFVYRPIERFFEGTPGRAKQGFLQTSGVGTVLKYLAFLVISAHLANTFLAYFVGVDNLMKWTLQSPLEHPAPFMVFAVVTGLMMFDFAFFREQTCLVACPYGRFQSVLLDRQSLIVSYDRKRGEPRGKAGKAAGSTNSADISLNVLASASTDDRSADCVDCGLCVTTCPTGIDIRNGLQMECIHCTQCIDACDAVMSKLNRPRGLIRYASQSTIDREPKRRWRPRLVVYPSILAIVITAFVVTLVSRAPVEVKLLRARGTPFNTTATGDISNSVQIKLINRLDQPASYHITVAEPAGLAIELAENPVVLQPGQMRTLTASIIAPPATFTGHGSADALVKIEGGPNFSKQLAYRVFGPSHTPATPAPKKD